MQKILLGNEAIVQGALEAGVQFVSTYPGTPASEIGDTFSRLKKTAKGDFYFEYSTNEKVALEAGIGASFSGLKTLVAMKNFGLNVCLDALLPFCYTGSKGPTVIIVADDPSCHSSAQSEQNTRAFAHLAHIPVLEPSDPQECKDFVKLGLNLSKIFKMPVLIRTTTRVSHQSALVTIREIKKIKTKGEFIKEPERFVTLPPRVLEMKKELLEKIEKIKDFSDKSPLNFILNENKKTTSGIITSAISYLYVREGKQELNLSLPTLKLGFFYPLPERKIKNFIKGLRKVLVVEELEPYLEREVKILAKEVNPKLQVFGKNYLSGIGELKPEDVIQALAKFTRKKWKISQPKFPDFPKRKPTLCPGCPYWSVFAAVKKVAPKDTIFGGDIGCYMLAGFPPHNIQDWLSCMGSSIGIAHGIKKSTDQKLITFIGDSTFFHAGIPALINTVNNQSSPLIIVMENSTTAMTGHQPHPGLSITGSGKIAPEIKIEDIVRACGVKYLKVIDPVKNFKEMTETIKEFLKKDKVSVIIACHPCARLKT